MEENKDTMKQQEKQQETKGQPEQEKETPSSHRAATDDMEEISLREILEVLLQRKGFIALVVIICVIASFVFTRFFQTSTYASATVALRFEQVEEGTYPSGEAFSPSDMISTSILSRVTEELGLDEAGITGGDLRGLVSVEPLYGADADGELTEPLYQYRLTVAEHEDLSPRLQRRIISSIIEHYRNANKEEFIETPLFPRFALEKDELMSVDYPFAMANLLSYHELMVEAAKEIAEKAEGYRSSSTGLTFEDFTKSLDVLKETEYRDISSFISEKRLARDPEMTLMRYRGMIQELEREGQKMDNQSRYAQELLREAKGLRKAPLPVEFPLDFSVRAELEDYEPEEWEGTELFQMLFEENFFRHILDVSVETGVAAIDTGTRIAALEREMQRLEEEAPRGAEQEELMDQVDSRLEEFTGSMDHFSEKLNQMTLEYYQGRPKEMIAYVVPPYQMVETGNLQLNLAVAGVLGLMLGVFAAFFQHYWQSTDRKKEEE